MARAIAKAPDQRHRSIGDFRYELQNVMAMLGLRQRRTTDRGGRERLLAQGFDLVSLPQALLDGDGALVVVNAAFAKMLGREPAALVGAGPQRVQVALWLARTSAPGVEVHAFLRLRRLRDAA